MPSSNFTASCSNLIGHRIDGGRLVFESVLGVGAYGVVYRARDWTRSSPTYYAVKCLNNVGLDARQRHFQRRELSLHRLASSHPSIVSIHRIIETPTIVYVILEYLPDGDLFGMITESQRYIGDNALITEVFLQILDAVGHCHELGIFHRDLKPENVLCSQGGERLMIADFGLATSEKTSTDFGCGSTFYMSPETQGGVFARPVCYSTAQNDIWSLGVILVNLTCGRNPWRQATTNDETFRAFLADPDFLRSILPVSLATNHILKAIFEIDPSRRIGIKQLRELVKGVRNWTMDEDELMCATDAARKAAEASGCPAAVRVKERLHAVEEERLRRQYATEALLLSQASVPPPSHINPPFPPHQPILSSFTKSNSLSDEVSSMRGIHILASSNGTGSTYAEDEPDTSSPSHFTKPDPFPDSHFSFSSNQFTLASAQPSQTSSHRTSFHPDNLNAPKSLSPFFANKPLSPSSSSYGGSSSTDPSVPSTPEFPATDKKGSANSSRRGSGAEDEELFGLLTLSGERAGPRENGEARFASEKLDELLHIQDEQHVPMYTD